MNRPELDRPDPDTESMFDFLDEEAANVTRVRPKRPVDAPRRASAGRSLPIIRKPVPVSESGPLRPPSSSGPNDVDDFAFLAESDFRGEAFDTTRSAAFAPEEESPGGRLRPLLYLLAFTLIIAGAIVVAWPRLQQAGVLEGLLGGSAGRTVDAPATATADGAPDAVAPPTRVADTPAVEPSEAAPSPVRPPGRDAPRSLGERFREQVGRVETLVADGRLDEAESAIAGLDRAVYGYGIAEFSALEERIASLRSGTAPTVATDVDAAAAARAEAERQAEAERAEIERAAAEADRLEARRLEIERAADAERRAAAERAAETERADAAEAIRRERAASERAAREAEAAATRAEAREAARLRAEALAAEREAVPVGRAATAPIPAPGPSADAAATTAAAAAAAAEARQREADARATDLRIAEQRAAALAEERRLAALEASAPRPRTTIDDDDLQIVYASLLELKSAFEERDIARVIALSDPPGGRVQQLLQVFANSATVETRITNVSARPADDTVTGTLRIEDVRRADGSAIRLPDGLASIALTSTREGDGWSSLSW